MALVNEDSGAIVRVAAGSTGTLVSTESRHAGPAQMVGNFLT